MSTLIVKMRNNPENCAECLACVVGMDEHVFYCAIERSIIAESVLMNRQSWCPIGGVLPDKHGDLIDRAKLLKDIEVYHISEGCFQHWVELQDAVVEKDM